MSVHVLVTLVGLVALGVGLVALGVGFIGGFLMARSTGEAPRVDATPTLTLRGVRYRPAVLQSIAEN